MTINITRTTAVTATAAARPSGLVPLVDFSTVVGAPVLGPSLSVVVGTGSTLVVGVGIAKAVMSTVLVVVVAVGSVEKFVVCDVEAVEILGIVDAVEAVVILGIVDVIEAAVTLGIVDAVGVGT